MEPVENSTQASISQGFHHLSMGNADLFKGLADHLVAQLLVEGHDPHARVKNDFSQAPLANELFKRADEFAPYPLSLEGGFDGHLSHLRLAFKPLHKGYCHHLAIFNANQVKLANLISQFFVGKV